MGRRRDATKSRHLCLCVIIVVAEAGTWSSVRAAATAAAKVGVGVGRGGRGCSGVVSRVSLEFKGIDDLLASGWGCSCEKVNRTPIVGGGVMLLVLLLLLPCWC